MYRKGTALLTSALLVFMGVGLYAAEQAQDPEARGAERPQEQTEHDTWEGRLVDLKSYLMGEEDVERGAEQPEQQPEEQPGEFGQPEERGAQRPGIWGGEASGPYALIVEEEGVLGTPLGEATTAYVLLFEEAEGAADQIRAIEREQPREEQRGLEGQQEEDPLQQQREEDADRLQQQPEERGIGAGEHGATEEDAKQMVDQEVRVTGRLLERDGFEAIMVERIERHTGAEEVEEQEEDVLDF